MTTDAMERAMERAVEGVAIDAWEGEANALEGCCGLRQITWEQMDDAHKGLRRTDARTLLARLGLVAIDAALVERVRATRAAVPAGWCICDDNEGLTCDAHKACDEANHALIFAVLAAWEGR